MQKRFIFVVVLSFLLLVATINFALAAEKTSEKSPNFFQKIGQKISSWFVSIFSSSNSVQFSPESNFTTCTTGGNTTGFICRDYDCGADISTKSYSEFWDITYPSYKEKIDDSCMLPGQIVSNCSGPDCFLREAICEEGGSALGERHVCPNGCSNGTCIPTITCSEDSDCGGVKFERSCWNGNLINNVTSGKCNSPGTAQSSCSSQYLNYSQIPCQYGCENNACLSQPQNQTPLIINNPVINSSPNPDGSSSVNIFVTTSQNATCSFAYPASPTQFLTFYSTGGIQHNQLFEHHSPGSYSLLISCTATTGASVNTNVSFVVNQAPTCTDSDGGKDYYVYGETRNTGWNSYFADSCGTDGTTYWLTENYCSATGSATYESFTCPYKCANGACFNQTFSCLDADGGENYYTPSLASGTYLLYNNSTTLQDYCSTNFTLYEAVCFPDYVGYKGFDCPSGTSCSNGACINNPLPTCQSYGYSYGNVSLCSSNSGAYDLSGCYNKNNSCLDRDLGENQFFIASNISVGSYTIKGPGCNDSSSGGGGGGGLISDVCANNFTLIERTCNSNKEADIINYTCPNGCSNGACLRTCTDFDGDNIYNKSYTTGLNASGSRVTVDDSCYLYGQVNEAGCDSSGSTVIITPKSCPMGLTCTDGACANKFCIDSDNGTNYAVSGYVKTNYPGWDPFKENPDKCSNANGFTNNCSGLNCSVVELYCVGQDPNYAFSNCPNGCSNGACIPPKIINSTVSEKQTVTLVLKDKTYKISLASITAQKVKITINSVTTPFLTKGQEYQLKDGTTLKVVEIYYRTWWTFWNREPNKVAFTLSR